METLGAFFPRPATLTFDEESGKLLDMTYIYPQAIVCAKRDVRSYLERVHKGFYRIYDLRRENKGATQVVCPNTTYEYGFWEHNPPPLSTLIALVEDIKMYLLKNPLRVAVIQCEGGRGRSGMVIACLLISLGYCHNATLALDYFNTLRTHCGRGVHIPSEIRYVHYFEVSSRRGLLPIKWLHIRHIRIHGAPMVDGGPLYFDVRVRDGRQKVFCWKHSLCNKAVSINRAKAGASTQDFDLEGAVGGVRCEADTKIVFYSVKGAKVFRFWFHTAYVHGEVLVLHKSVIDDACEDTRNKVFPSNFAIEIHFKEVENPGDPLIAMEELGMEDHEEDTEQHYFHA